MAKKKADADKPVTLSDVGRHVAFGVICGSARPRRPRPDTFARRLARRASQMTGLAVGAVDTYRLVKAGGRTVDQSRVARLAFHEMGRSGLVVSVFFALYQVCKCGIAAAGIEAPEVKVGGATAASLAPLSVLPATRRLSPYCLTLVAVDSYHTYFAPDSR